MIKRFFALFGMLAIASLSNIAAAQGPAVTLPAGVITFPATFNFGGDPCTDPLAIYDSGNAASTSIGWDCAVKLGLGTIDTSKMPNVFVFNPTFNFPAAGANNPNSPYTVTIVQGTLGVVLCFTRKATATSPAGFPITGTDDSKNANGKGNSCKFTVNEVCVQAYQSPTSSLTIIGADW